MEKQGSDGKRVVILGGGVAGSLLAKSLQFIANVTLIDPKEYFEIPWACLRAMVEPSFAERTLINHRDYLTNVKIVVSSAVNVTETEVLTADGDQFAYHYLVIATGHADPVPKKRTFTISNSFAWEERSCGAITLHYNQWTNSWHPQVWRSVCW